jgi:hypothetical protein
MRTRQPKRGRYASPVRLAVIPPFLVVAACHSNPAATPCGQGHALCDADAGLLCVQESGNALSVNAPQTCESTISCLQPLGAPPYQSFVASTWAQAQEECNSQQLTPTSPTLAPTPCDGLVAFSEVDPALVRETGLYAADSGALVAVYLAGNPAACVAGDVIFTASCLQTLLNEQVMCGQADAGADSSPDAD